MQRKKVNSRFDAPVYGKFINIAWGGGGAPCGIARLQYQDAKPSRTVSRSHFNSMKFDYTTFKIKFLQQRKQYVLKK
jgi:hypothetical protein